MPNQTRYSGLKGIFAGMEKGIELQFRPLMHQITRGLPKGESSKESPEKHKPVVQHVNNIKFSQEEDD